ncbi:hypothetical protein PAP_08515 [Palaeococcus pacificus DY20341]|uniref:Pyruvate kinase n=1 Tax=Palaeococcus pacificus DY20341 TaxID=1343739 RepID=A0A075LUR3_9EURY|nr:pyruvate kinase [Palaeococcus pacificus]AIF70084.1 hypothetical protein PAP_08515 [Palaeococcus pacificus DY20341]
MKLPSQMTKIVGTIGPSSDSKEVLEELIKYGLNIARINFAHGSFEEHERKIKLVREISEKLNRRVAILGDLPGPKLRIGELEKEPITLEKGKDIVLTTSDIRGNEEVIPVEFKRLPEALSKGDELYLNDGFIKLKVEDVQGSDIKCRVIVGGVLSSHKGINIPKADIPIETPTKRDFEILEFLLDHDVDAVGISFVRSARDVLKVKEFVKERGKDIFVIAKIERPEAVRNINEILEVADGIMVARGDLGVEMPIEELPIIQKKLIFKANLVGKPVITATQMLESMTSDIRPTRAEATDVANAILDGTDAVMLSEETAVGAYPVEAVKTMARIAKVVEFYRNSLGENKVLSYLRQHPHKMKVVDAISLSIMEAIRTLRIKYILAQTRSGATARRISRFKPKQWILAFTDNKRVCNTLMFSYGVYPFYMEERNDRNILRFVKEHNLAKSGDTVLLTEEIKLEKQVGTNSMKIFTLA